MCFLRFTYLEAFGRTVCGIAPWLELGPDETPEGQLRAKYIDLTVKAFRQAVDPDSPDRLVFDGRHTQPLVDAAFLAEGVLRAPTMPCDPVFRRFPFLSSRQAFRR